MSSGRRGGRNDEGMMALELAILTPAVIAMLLAVVALGRIAQAHQYVDQASAAASRAASLATSPGQAASAARSAAVESLAQAGVLCTRPSVDVDTAAFRPGGDVTATVHCTADLSAMTLIGLPGAVALQATTTSPLETRRDLTGAVGTP